MGQKSSKQAADLHPKVPILRPKQSRKLLRRDRTPTARHEHTPVPNFHQQLPLRPTYPPPLPRKPRQGQINYRALDRKRGEFRLLKILPATRSAHRPDGYDFDPDIIQCQIEYKSMDRIDELNREAATTAAGLDLAVDLMFRDIPGVDNRVRDYLKDGARCDLETELDECRSFVMHPQRVHMLRAHFTAFSERQQRWLPPDFMSYTSAHEWTNWLQTWVWNPLSGHDKHPQKDKGGFMALSYTWNDAQPLEDLGEDGHEAKRLFQAAGISYAQAIEAIGVQEANQIFGRSGEGESSKVRIIVDGILVEVGRSLEKALRSLREIPEVQCGKRVWVDGLCINQADHAEKSYEVARMGQIYGGAESVVSWIGDEEDFSGDVLEIMAIIGQSRLTGDDMAELAGWFIRNIRSDFVLRVAQLLSRPYFSRIWIAQEVVLGNNKAFIICDLDDFQHRNCCNSALAWRGHAGYRKPVSAMALGRGLMKLRELRTIQANLEVLTSESAFANTLWFRVASASFATDPRDIVYGMLNILPKRLVSLLTIDYSDGYTYRDVMVNFAVANFTTSQSLGWLLLRPWSPFPGCGLSPNSLSVPPWPSWVPNLGLQFSFAHFNWSFGSNCNEGSSWPQYFEAMTTGGHYDVPLLVVSGLCIDVIREATVSQATEKRAMQQGLIAVPHIEDEIAELAGIPPDVFRRMNRKAITDHFPEPPPIPGLILQNSRQHRYGDLYGLQRALSQCFDRMTLRVRHESESMFDIPLSLLEQETAAPSVAELSASPTIDLSAMSYLKHRMGTFGGLDLWGLRLRDLFVSDDSRMHGKPVPELTVFDRTPSLARLFTTCSGYVGAALCPLRAGDQIYIIPGCGMPVALRPSPRSRDPRTFEMLGGVFVPGIMHGEAWQSLDNSELPQGPETIVLV
ncbi:hypothetical protein LTR49_020543 [Elasticomyces elasticus]|nr:hypothetical protein LTR49_020543 [Elasticomyces elasticus]KAK5750426.1 hypothetical protein LTS12_019534 [Elasticomyces elasticus]